MAKRKDEARVNLIVGAFVISMLGLLVFSMFIIATSEGLLEAKADIYTDFRTVTGLTRDSPVQLAGSHELFRNTEMLAFRSVVHRSCSVSGNALGILCVRKLPGCDRVREEKPLAGCRSGQGAKNEHRKLISTARALTPR